MTTTTMHLCQDLQGALDRWEDRLWDSVCRDNDGNVMSPAAVKAYFQKCLAEGKRVIPFGACDNFDYQKGCLGHDKPDEPKGPTIRDHWKMVEQDKAKLDLDAAVTAAGWLRSIGPYPFTATCGPDEIRDGHNNLVNAEEIVACVNHIPALVLEARRSQLYRRSIEQIIEDCGAGGCGCLKDGDRDCVLCTLQDTIQEADGGH